MGNESREAIQERNVGRMVRRWADPLSPERVDDASRDFLRRVAAPAPEAPAKPPSGGRFGFAAALLLGAVTFWAIFSWRGDRVAAPGASIPAETAQADDDAEIQRLLANLRSSSFEEQGRAAENLERLGLKAVAALERATKHEDSQLRDWAVKILERIRKSDESAMRELLAAIEMGPLASRRLARDGGVRVTESAVLAALKWLARHQNADGSWGAFQVHCGSDPCGGTGERDYDTGLTAMSLLAFIGAGYTQLSRDEYPDPANPGRLLKFGDVVKKGLLWLLAHQDPEGCVGRRGPKYGYNHASAALCLSEAYGMTASQQFKAPAQKAIDFLVAAQNPGKGWRYSAKCGDNDTSVTGWAVFALRSAEISGLHVPRASHTGATNWLNEVTAQDGTFQAGYNARGTGKVSVAGKNENFVHHPTMSAIAVISRIFMGQKKTEPAMASVNLLVSDLPEWTVNKIDFYYWHFGSLALHQYDGPDGPLWRRWNEPMKNALIPNQKLAKDGCRNGSWDSEQERWGAEGGRVYTTAIGALTLETYYRYARVWEEKK